ncbi:MAG: SusD/RagB family nutrient-binding outer membrane lipoprotein, partial [Mucilaginibacter sp.]
MKLKYTAIIASLLLLSEASCKRELVDINQNVNGSQTAQPNYLLTAATKATADTYWGVANSMDASLLFVQYWAKIQYTDPDRYIYTNNSFQELWTIGYSKSIVNLNQIIKLADAQGNPNYKGVALVLRSWNFALLTDAYGDIPYKQSANIDQSITPAYDTQKNVYYGLLDDLKAAQAALNPSGKAIAGDIIYANNITLWKKFANSLRLRIALRIADRDAAKAKQVLDDIQAEGSGYISSNSEIAQLVYLDSPNQNPVS